MCATHATCIECGGEGEVFDGQDCLHCQGPGECDCDECINTAAENAFSDMCESEPPLSANERHQMAWQQKQERDR